MPQLDDTPTLPLLGREILPTDLIPIWDSVNREIRAIEVSTLMVKKEIKKTIKKKGTK